MSKSHDKKYYITANKKSKQTLKNLQKKLDEYIEESGKNISFHNFFVEVLNYTENDFINLIKFINRKKNQKKKSKDKNTLRKNNV